MKTVQEFGVTVSGAINEATEGNEYDVLGGAFVILSAGVNTGPVIDFASVAGHLCPVTAERLQLALRMLADGLESLVEREPALAAVQH